MLLDQEGFLVEATVGTVDVAGDLAREQGLEVLEELHWKTIRFLREYFLAHGKAPMGRDIRNGTGLSLLEIEQLFPGGLKEGARRLTGLPNPRAACRKAGERGEVMIYLDNAATSFPKPAECLRKALELYLQMGASTGRGGYDLAVAAKELVEAVRRRLCRFFGGDDTYRLCFTYNATGALNMLFRGLAPLGSHVVSSRLEHNAVLRPLCHLREQGAITFDLVPFDRQGFIAPQQVAGAIKPETRLVILTHDSNVLGTVQPAKEIGAVCRHRKVPLVLDASQSAGAVPIDVQGLGRARERLHRP